MFGYEPLEVFSGNVSKKDIITSVTLTSDGRAIVDEFQAEDPENIDYASAMVTATCLKKRMLNLQGTGRERIQGSPFDIPSSIETIKKQIAAGKTKGIELIRADGGKQLIRPHFIGDV